MPLVDSHVAIETTTTIIIIVDDVSIITTTTTTILIAIVGEEISIVDVDVVAVAVVVVVVVKIIIIQTIEAIIQIYPKKFSILISTNTCPERRLEMMRLIWMLFNPSFH